MSLFVNSVVDHNFQPYYEVTIPGNYKIELLIPLFGFFLQLILSVLFQVLCSCIFGTVIYYAIVRNNTCNPNHVNARGILIGYGLIIPLALSLPFGLINTFDIRLKFVRMSMIALPLTLCSLCLEAVHGFTPPIAQSSIQHYLYSVACILRPKYCNDKKEGNNYTKILPASGGYILYALCKYLISVVVVGLIVASPLGPTSFAPFPTTRPSTDFYISFDLGQIYNTFFQASVSNIILHSGMLGASLLLSLVTMKQFNDDVTRYPLFLSSSVSDFWGERWNRLIHYSLKQGVYKPVRWYTQSKSLAALSTFIMSGIMHEYVWYVLFYYNSFEQKEENDGNNNCATCYQHYIFGKQLVFFGWNGLLIVLEYIFGDKLLFLKRYLPSLLISHLIVLLALPAGHLFTGDLAASGFYKETIGFSIFRISKIE